MSKELTKLLEIKPKYKYKYETPAGSTFYSDNSNLYDAEYLGKEEIILDFKLNENFVCLQKLISKYGYSIRINFIESSEFYGDEYFHIAIGNSSGSGKTLEESLINSVTNYIKDKINIGGVHNENQLQKIREVAKELQWDY